MLGSTIQRELAQIIMRELNDPRLTGLPSITRVKVSPDLSIADVYVTIMGTQGQQNAALNALKHSAGMMRTKLTHALTLRQAPFLKFHIDEGLKKEMEVLEAIRWHTLGSAHWGRTGKALYMADFLEPGRPFSRADRAFLAAHVTTDFDGVFRQVVRTRIEWTVREGKMLFPETADLWNSVR